MNAVKQRPFAFSCILFLISSFLFVPLGVSVKYGIIALLLVCLILAFVFKLEKRFTPIFIIVPLLMSAVISVICYDIHYKSIEFYKDKTYNADFVITDEYKITDSFCSYTARLNSLNGEKVNFSAIIVTEKPLERPMYSSYSAKTTFRQRESTDTLLGAKYNIRSDGFLLTTDPLSELNLISRTEKIFPGYYFYKANAFLDEVLKEYLSEKAYSLTSALLLGNKMRLDSSVKYKFRLLGMSHMLAVSGLHLSILIGSLEKLLSKLRIKRNVYCIILIITTAFYAGLTGSSSSVKRAAVMLILYYLSFFTRQFHDSLTSLCFAAAFICFFDPPAILDIGLWLSFFSTYGIITYSFTVTRKNLSDDPPDPFVARTLKKLYHALLLGVFPVFFSLPIVWISYGEISPISPFTNLLFSPLLTYIMYLCPILPLLLPISYLPTLLGSIISFLSELMLKLIDFLSNYSTLVAINYRFTVYFVLFFIGSVLILSLIKQKRLLYYAVIFALCVSAFSVCVNKYNASLTGRTEAVYTGTFEGESILILRDNSAFLADISGGSYSIASKNAEILQKNHITKLDSYLLTQYNSTFIDTFSDILSVYKTKNLYLPKPNGADEEYLSEIICKTAQNAKTDVIFYDTHSTEHDDNINFLGVKISVKNVFDKGVNSPSAICLSISNDKDLLSYVGLGSCHSSFGKSYTTELFNKFDNVIFGTYGPVSASPGLLSVYYRDNVKINFPTEEIKTMYTGIIPSIDNISIIGRSYIFRFDKTAT